MGHRLGLHWQRQHSDNQADFGHIARMKYKSFTLFEGTWDNVDFCRGLLAVTEPDAIFLLRDHPLSEEKQAVISDPAGFGTAHGMEWAKKWQAGKIPLPVERCYHLGINELDTNQYQVQNNVYTEHFTKSLAAAGLRCAGWSFGVGHPSTKDLDPKGKPDWSWYRTSADALIRHNGIAAVHEYWWDGDYNWGNWVGRYLMHCPYDIPFVVKESFHDGGLVGKPKRGFHDNVDLANKDDVYRFLGEVNYVMSRLSTDPRFHSVQGFTYDFAHPWDSFDIRPIRHHFETYPWNLSAEREKTVLPSIKQTQVVKPGDPLLTPFLGIGTISQRFGENPQNYAQFGLPGHNGLDYALPQGTQVISIAAGKVEWVGEDPLYGNYVRVFHPELRLHSFYAHLEKFLVRQGEPVKRGQALGTVGSTGNSTGPHLHLEIRLAHPDGSYRQGTHGYGKGRVDPETVYAVLNGE